MRSCNRGTTVSPSATHYTDGLTGRARRARSESDTCKMLPTSAKSESGKNSLTNFSLHRSAGDSRSLPPRLLRRRALDYRAGQNEVNAVQGPWYHKPVLVVNLTRYGYHSAEDDIDVRHAKTLNQV
jgi:hypothetical protein